jgi:tripartite-type tricarboxylate transporter receptor subunit TctC
MSRFLASILFALAACSLVPASAAYPDRVIKIVVPFAPGGGTDVVARTLAQEMAKELGASVIIENKPGAGPFSAPRWSRPARRMVTRC